MGQLNHHDWRGWSLYDAALGPEAVLPDLHGIRPYLQRCVLHMDRDSWSDIQIIVKELLPIVMGTVMWGVQWYGRSVKCQCDNGVMVAIIWSGTTRDEWAMHLMRCLFFFVANST